MMEPTFTLVDSDLDEDDGIFLTQAVRSESQILLNQTMWACSKCDQWEESLQFSKELTEL